MPLGAVDMGGGGGVHLLTGAASVFCWPVHMCQKHIYIYIYIYTLICESLCECIMCDAGAMGWCRYGCLVAGRTLQTFFRSGNCIITRSCLVVLATAGRVQLAPLLSQGHFLGPTIMIAALVFLRGCHDGSTGRPACLPRLIFSSFLVCFS